MRQNLVRHRFSSLLATVGVLFFTPWVQAQTLPPDSPVVRGASLRQSEHEVFLEINYRGELTVPPATPFILKGPNRWIVDIPGELDPITNRASRGVRVSQLKPGTVRVVADSPLYFQPRPSTPGRLIYAAQLAKPTLVAQAEPNLALLPPKTVEVKSPIPTASDLLTPQGASASALLPERETTAGSGTTARQLIAQRLDFAPVSFNGSLVLSDQTNITFESLIAQKIAEPTVAYKATPLERPALGTQSLEGAELLKPGELMQTQGVRLFFPKGTDDDDLFTNLTTTYAYGLTDNVQLSLALQGQDNNGPGSQGRFLSERFDQNRGATSNSFQEFTLQAKVRLVDEPMFKSSVVVSGTSGRRIFTSFPIVPGNINATKASRIEQDFGSSVIPVVESPFTWTDETTWAITLSPKLGFLPQDNAGFVGVNPGQSGGFGIVGAVGIGGTYKFSERFSVRGDITPVLFGKNAIDSNTGAPRSVPIFNAGVRYLVNPRVGLDVYVTNAYGSVGLGSLVGRAGEVGIGASLTVIPNRIFVFDLPENRKFAKTFDLSVPEAQRKAFVRGGFTFLDGGTIPEGQTYVQLKGGSNGFLASVRSGTFDDFETGFFANFTASDTDESEAGFSTKLRFMNQAAGDPVTLSAVVTVGRTSNRFLNFSREQKDASQTQTDPFNAGIGDRGPLAPNLFGFFTERIGETFIATVSFPIQQTGETFSWWVTPKGSYVQRVSRVALAGISFGASYRFSPSLEVIGEVTPVFNGKNTLVNDGLGGVFRQRNLPWNVGLRWSPDTQGPTSVDLYATNALGLSPYQSMRVNVDNGIVVGVGVNFPVQLPF